MSRRRLTIRTAIKAVVVAIILFVAYATYAYLHKVDIGERVVSIIIEPGDGFTEVGQKLLREGVVDSRPALFYGARIKDVDRKLVPGRYDFTGRNSCSSVLGKLERGEFVRIRVTVHEGAPIWRVASILTNLMEVDSAAVMQLNTDSAFLARLGVPCLEGYLYPETYFFPWGTDLEKILTAMVGMYNSQTEGIWPDSMPSGHSREEIMVLASIIEAEAMLESEKPIIASVYQNRLNRNMRLDADPTVIYGLGGLDRPLWRRDLQKDTPYNTYRRRGLPPTPINSPGLSAIKAALEPAETDYLFFVADGSGGHRFSRTNAEHNRARYEIKQNSSNGGGD